MGQLIYSRVENFLLFFTSNRFVLMAQSLPRSMKTRSVRADKEIGVTCLSYNAEDKDMFIIGSESGCVFKCSMHAQGNPAGSEILPELILCSVRN